MMLSPAIFLIFLPCVLAASHPASRSNPIHVPLVRHARSSDLVANMPRVIDAFQHRRALENTNMKRSESAGSASLTSFGVGVYSGIVSVGTPPQNFSVNIDTAWPGLWLATTGCYCPSNVSLFDPSKSSTYQENISADTVTFGGFTLPDFQFLPIDNMTGDLEAQSGTMGLAFQPNATSETDPFVFPTSFWQELYEKNLLPQPVFGLYLERLDNPTDPTSTAPGGTLTLGGTDESLYTGNIEFAEMPNGTASYYWYQQVQSVTVQGKYIAVPSDSSVAEIYNSDVFIAAPSSISQQIWTEVPGSVPLTGEYQYMYGFPCTTNVSVSISFGGSDWAINPADMNLGPINSTEMCLGSIIDINFFNTTGPPYWAIGDAFLRNVYSVFQANPPAVGFAQLSSAAGSSTSGAVGGSLPSVSLALVMTLLTWFSIIA